MAPVEQVAARPCVLLENLNLAEMERRVTEAALAAAGSIVEAAQLMGITRHDLKRIIIKRRIEWPRGYRGPVGTPIAEVNPCT